jgi:SAM-dependent methyltransferase
LKTWPVDGYALDDSFLRARLVEIIAEREIDTVVETGLGGGRSAREFCKIVRYYVGVDIDEERVVETQELLEAAGLNNYELHVGNAPDVLREIMPRLRPANTLFFLDAHVNFPESGDDPLYWPLPDEIKAIPTGVLAFHDFRVPGKDFGVDGYVVDGVVRDFNYELVKPYLDAWSPSHRIEYMDQASGSYRGVGFAYPS